MKRTAASTLFLAFLLLAILPVALPNCFVAAQNGSYSIDSVEHQVQVTYTGNVVIQDTIHVSGRITGGFVIGFPYQYSADVIKAVAYDENNVYDMNFGVQLGNRTGLYAAQVNFNGNSPSEFTVAFILSNRLLTEDGEGNFTLDYPAYPSLAMDTTTCSVTLTYPSTPTDLKITKADGNTQDPNYQKTNLPAYTYATATAIAAMPTGTIQLTTVSSLNREITMDPTGTVAATDTYRIVNNATTSLGSFMLVFPAQAANIVVRDSTGTALSTSQSTSPSGNTLLVDTTLSTGVDHDQSTVLAAHYNLPGATLQSARYVLSDFERFPDFPYLVAHATVTFTPPEGATIVEPQANTLDLASTLTRNTYQDTLTVTKDSISYVDYLVPQQNTEQLAYTYNPVWVSFRPTFLASFAAAVACVGAVVYQRRKPKVKTYETRAEWLPPQKPSVTPEHPEVIKTGQPITAENIRNFIDAYEDKKQLRAELKSLDMRAQKGKIPRRQYNAQRKAVEDRLEGINRVIDHAKAVFRGSGGIYPDLIKQLDLAEADLAQAEEIVRTLEAQQNKGEISLETYKRVISDYQKVQDRAESSINGILLRLRGKIR